MVNDYRYNKKICNYNNILSTIVFVFLFAVRNKNNITYEEVILKVPTFQL